MLVRGPGDSFDGGGVVTKLPERCFVEFVPDHEFVVVAARGELSIFGVPVEAANFLFVANKLAEILFGLPHITVIDETIAGARSQDVIIPGQGAHAGSVTRHGAETPLLFCVPDLDKAFISTDGNMSTALDPRHGCNNVILKVA